MTQNQIYAKNGTLEGDGWGVNAPFTMNSTVIFPSLVGGTQNALSVSNFIGGAAISNPAITGPPITIAANTLNFFVIFGLQQSSGVGFVFAILGTTTGLLGTVTAATPSILFPGWLPLGYRPALQTRIPIAGQIGPVAQATTLIFQLETNGDIRIFKDAINTGWSINDTLTINPTSDFTYQAIF